LSRPAIAAGLHAGELRRLIGLRRDIHRHPELGFFEHRTAGLVAEALRALGLDVHCGIGGTGVVGSLRRGSSSRSVSLRADMDALPIDEHSGVAHASQASGAFHGCGHDGHVAMLVGAAGRLAADPNLDGTVHFVFQPAEEGLGGARRMIEDGLFERFPCDRIYALHNWPELPLGTIATRPGPIMAAADKFEIELRGEGGHAAMPHRTPDVLLAAGQLVMALNTLIPRRIPATESAVLSVTRISGGNTHNVMPPAVQLMGTVRSFEPAVQDVVEAELRRHVDATAWAHGLSATIKYDRYYPATRNHPDAARDALSVLGAVATVEAARDPSFGSEDFAFMLEACPGAYIWLGVGAPGHRHPLHHPCYDFNDDALGIGVMAHVALAKAHLQPQLSDGATYKRADAV
jgi:amidohydrolase